MIFDGKIILSVYFYLKSSSIRLEFDAPAGYSISFTFGLIRLFLADPDISSLSTREGWYRYELRRWLHRRKKDR